jgi:hypothetical protein
MHLSVRGKIGALLLLAVLAAVAAALEAAVRIRQYRNGAAAL